MILFTSFREIFITYLQSAEGSRFQIENFQGKKVMIKILNTSVNFKIFLKHHAYSALTQLIGITPHWLSGHESHSIVTQFMGILTFRLLSVGNK